MQSFISRLYANKSQKFDYQHEDRTGPSADRWRLLLVDPCHYRRLIWRIALCVRR
ncbi:class I SAM-dependent methyltransferase family protein [Shigella flexneri]